MPALLSVLKVTDAHYATSAEYAALRGLCAHPTVPRIDGFTEYHTAGSMELGPQRRRGRSGDGMGHHSRVRLPKQLYSRRGRIALLRSRHCTGSRGCTARSVN